MNKYCINLIENETFESRLEWSNLSFQQANDLLIELNALESCHINTRVTPIITLHFSTKLPAFSVDSKGRHYQYKILRDIPTEFSKVHGIDVV